MGQPEEGELALQRRWAEGRWPTPFLPAGGGVVRVISPGRWNRGAGPDFRQAQILDANGRARRGDVEFHRRPSDWLAHGHSADPAYANLLLHLVAPDAPAGNLDPRIPPAAPLPLPLVPHAEEPLPPPPCTDAVPRLSAEAVSVRLLSVARRRFLRKAAELAQLAADPDQQALLAAARALGQPHNAAAAETAARSALAQPPLQLEPPAQWRRGRGTLGTAAGFAAVWTQLAARWTQPQADFVELTTLPPSQAVQRLHLPRQLGPARARQLLADAVYPLAHSWGEGAAWERWQQLPPARYERTNELRQRLTGLQWKHPHTQALLELERTRCRPAACQICPLR